MKMHSTFPPFYRLTIGLSCFAFACSIGIVCARPGKALSRPKKIAVFTARFFDESYLNTASEKDTLPTGSEGTDASQNSGTGISSKFSVPTYLSPGEKARQTLRSDSIRRFKSDSLQNAVRLQEVLLRRHVQDSLAYADSLHIAKQNQRKADSISHLQAIKKHRDSLYNSNTSGQYYSPRYEPAGQNNTGRPVQNGQYYDGNRRSENGEPKRMTQKEYYAGKNYAIGAQLGINFAKALNSSGSVISDPTAGLLAGVFFQRGLQLFGSRTELNYSRQGFHYDDSGTKGKITNDYLSLLTMTTLSILHRAQVQFGTEEGYLLKSKDSNGGGSGGNDPISVFNRFDFGLAAGVEAYPFKGVIVGFRYNLGLTNLTKRPDNGIENYIPFYQTLTTYNLKNGVFTLHFGYQLPL